MRRWASALLVVGLAAGLVGVGAPASAAGPDPVIPLPYTPAQVSSVLSGFADGSKISDAYLKAYLLAYNAARNAGQSSTAASATAIAATPKPITAPAAIARGAGSALVAFQGGWAIGQGGLALYAMATGTTYQDVICNTTPDWYQAVNKFILLSIPADCGGRVVLINEDKPSIATFASGAVFNQYHWLDGSGNKWPIACGPAGASPTGHTYQANLNGTTVSAFAGGTSGYNCGSGGAPRQLLANGSASNYGKTYTNFQLRHTATGTIVDTAVESRANPTRTPGCTVTAGGQSYTATSSGYDEAGNIPLRYLSEACNNAWNLKPSGAIPTKISTHSTDEAGAKTTISDQDVNPGAVPAEATPGGGGLVLEKVVGSTTQSCMDWLADCANWWTETSSGTVTGLYRCMFGGVEVSLTQCAPYENTFKSQTATPVITDPLTGNPTQWAASPSPGNSISPGVGPGVGPSPADTCFTEGWASVANPVDWVLVPVKCALVWAFVPRGSVVSSAQSGMQAKIDGSVIGSVSAGLVTLGAAWDAGVGCGGLPIHLEGFGVTLVHANLLESCTEPAAGIAATVKTILTGVIIFGAFLAVMRYLASLFGFIGFGGGRDGVAPSESGPRFS